MTNNNYIHDTAKVQRSTLGAVKLYRNVVINDCEFGDGVSVGDDTTVERSEFESNVVINRRSYINDSKIGMFSYAGINTTVNWTEIGRFCSIGRNVDIGGIDHDYHKLTSMLDNRITQMMAGGGKYNQEKPQHNRCKIGNDVWIAAGAQILHKATIEDGAVIGAGAVITENVPPYAIVVGVPGRIIGYRCSDELINRLEVIKWWNWPVDVILNNYKYLLSNDISDESVSYLESITNAIANKDS